jgi:hypothetical protein
MVALGRAQPEGAGKRVEYLAGGGDVAALLQERVVGRRDAGELGDLLPPQARGAPAGAVGQPDVGGLEAGTPGREELTELPEQPDGDTPSTSNNVLWLLPYARHSLRP